MPGWWGHTLDTRFQMPAEFEPIPGARGWQQSNPSVFAAAPLLGSLEVFHEAGISRLRKKSVKLTGYLERLLRGSQYYNKTDGGFTILTPADPNSRGCQLSLRIFGGLMPKVYSELRKIGIVPDERKPDVIRVSPTPLYNTFEDCWRTSKGLEKVLSRIEQNGV